MGSEAETTCDVVVVGAGPAGSIAARVLATAGITTTLLEKATFPRDKVCGDALIPDSLQLLKQEGLLDRVEAEGSDFNHLVNDEMIDAIFIAGEPGHCLERLLEVRDTARSQGFQCPR